jgi:pimeloyl-[acyl-carrier protein] methyl ester esterase
MEYDDVGAGRPVVFLHGWGMRRDYFAPQVRALAGSYRCIVPDLRGHGASSPVAEGQGLETLTGDLAELLCSLDLQDVTLVGWSMGAMLCWDLMHGPEAGRVSGLVSIDMVPRLLNEGAWLFGLRNGDGAEVFNGAVESMRRHWGAFTRIFVPRIVAKGQEERQRELLRRIVSDTRGNDPESMARLWTSMACQDFRELLQDIQVPCLVTYGALSKLYRVEASHWLLQRLPHALGVRFEHSGHAPHLEEPDRFNEELCAFLVRTRAGRAIRIGNA